MEANKSPEEIISYTTAIVTAIGLVIRFVEKQITQHRKRKREREANSHYLRK